MVVLALTLKADLEGISSVKLATESALSLSKSKKKVEERQTAGGYWVTLTFPGGETKENVYISSTEKLETEKGKGEFNFVIKQKGAKSQSTISIVSESKGEYESESSKPLVVCTCDCRGCEITSFVVDERTPLIAITPSGKQISVALEGGEFYDVDPDTSEPISITNIETGVVRA